MKTSSNRIVAAALTALTSITMPVSASFAADVDWKLYGGLSPALSGNEYCFYEEKSVARIKFGFVRVWSKCLLQRDLDAISAAKPYYRAMIDMSASRIAHYYIPPILKIERMNSDQAMQVTNYESIADVGDLSPSALIFYEIDCKQRKERELSIYVGNKFSDTPRPWRDVPPEGNGANLLTLLCPFD